MRASVFTAREAIWVRGDLDFTAANGVVSGSGTIQDPYVIAGWDILVAGSKVLFIEGCGDCRTGILIENTAVHFVIRNVFVHHGLTSSANIVLKNVVNGRVEASRVEAGNIGILLWKSAQNNTVVQNNVAGFGIGIELSRSDRNLVHGNLIQDSDRPIFALGSSYNSFLGNVMEGAALGVSINRNSSFNVFEGNTIRDSNFGVSVSLDSNWNLVSRNMISVEREGVVVGGSRENGVRDNIILDSGLGILLNQAFQTTVESNSIAASTRTFPLGVERFTGKGVWVVDSVDSWIAANRVVAPVGISICRSTFSFPSPPPDHVTLLFLNDLSGGRPIAFGPTGCP